MLTKQHRFSFRNGVPMHSANSSLFVMRYERAEKFSCAIVVSKKVSSNAVDRNRLKRMYKNILAQVLLKSDINYSLVFYVRKKSNDVSEEEIRQSIEQIFRKEGIILS